MGEEERAIGNMKAIVDPLPTTEWRQLPAKLIELRDETICLKDLEERAKELRRRIADLQSECCEGLAEIGLQNLKFSDGTRCELWTAQTRASCFHLSKRPGISTDAAVAALKLVGLGCFVREEYVPQSVKAHVYETRRNLDPTRDPIEAVPEMLREIFEVYEEARVVFTGARRSATDERSSDERPVAGDGE